MIANYAIDTFHILRGKRAVREQNHLMSTQLTEFIANIREASSIEEERSIIASEQANMRTLVRTCDMELKPCIVAKLIYLNIGGENTSWGQMEAVSLMTHERLSYKKYGYLAVGTMLDGSNELIVLITHTVIKDLQSNSPFVQALALTLIANIGTPDMCQTVVNDVAKLTNSPHPGILKRAGMAAVQIVRTVPELANNFIKPMTALLSNTKHAVVNSGIILAAEMMKADPNLIQQWKHFSKPFTKLLRALSLSKPSAEFRLSIFNDPFLQIQTMRLLSLLGQSSDDLDDALTALVTAVDVRRNTGRSLLIQAVETIGHTAKKPSLCGLAFNQIGKLFSFREPNVLYSALSVFSRILYNGRVIIDRSSRDSLALQRYKSQIVHCLDHKDPSIRRRALDVVLALVDKSNVETLVPEIIQYLHLADSEFRTEMVSKLYSVVQRFAPSPMWNFDIVHLLLLDGGDYVGNDIITSFCKLIATHKDLHEHAIKLLSNTMYGYSSNQALIQVAAWVLGEFQGEAATAKLDLDVMINILKMPQTRIETKCYLISAIGKLAARFHQVDDAISCFEVLKNDSNIEIQQRSGEVYNLLKRPDLWDAMYAPVEYPSATDNSKGEVSQLPPTASQSAPDLLDLGDQTTHSPPKSKSVGEDLLDLIGPITTPSSKLVSGEVLSPTEVEIKPPPNAVEALRTNDFVIYFEIQKNAANPKQLAIRSTIFNLGTTPLNGFSIQYGVPVGWILKAQPISTNVLEARGGKPIQQVIMLENTGMAPLQMKTQASYMFGSQPLKSVDTMNPIFS